MNKPLDILITKLAQNDIKQITNYIAKDNKIAALKTTDNFYKTFEVLANYPKTGSKKSDIRDKTIRIYIIKKKFSIIYRIIENRIEILRVLTKYQNIFAILN